MIDTGPTLRCPRCCGPIGYWVVQPRFACHHCGTVLRSNHRQVQWRLVLAALGLWPVITVLASSWSARPLLELASLVGGVWLPTSLVLCWWGLRIGVRLTPEPAVPAALLFAAWPGPPRAAASAGADALGFHAAGEARAALAMVSRRPAHPDDPYDVDLSLRAMVWPTAEAATWAFASERAQDERLMRACMPLPYRADLSADEVYGWQASLPDATIAVQARYGRYLMRAAGRLHPDGLFPDVDSFVAALLDADRQLRQIRVRDA